MWHGETTPLDYGDYDTFEYFGFVIEDAMADYEKKEFQYAVLKFRDLAPLAEAVRSAHPGVEILGATGDDPEYWGAVDDGLTDEMREGAREWNSSFGVS